MAPYNSQSPPSPWLGWLLVALSVGAQMLGSTHSTESALRVGFVGALALAITLARPGWALVIILASSAILLTIISAPLTVLAVGSMAMWVALSGRSGMGREPVQAAAWGMVATAAVTAHASGPRLPLTILVATSAMGFWAQATTGPPRWVASASRWWMVFNAMPARLRRRHRGSRSRTQTRQEGGDLTSPLASSSTATPLLAWCGTTVLATWLQTVAVRTAEFGYSISTLLSFPSPTAGKGGWDTLYYINIAKYGYSLPVTQNFTSRPASDLVAYFPGYPLLIRAVALLPGIEEPLASIFIAWAGGLAATLLFWYWMNTFDLSRQVQHTALAVFLAYPYAFMLTGVAYADPLTLALVLGAFVLLEHDRNFAAGLVAAAATLTRPTALPIIVALPVLALERSGAIRWGRADVGQADTLKIPGSNAGPQAATCPGTTIDRPAFMAALRHRWGSLVAVSGIGAYALWLLIRTGNPLSFWSVQGNYGQGSALDLTTWFKVDFLRTLPSLGWSPELFNRLGALTATLVAGISLPFVSKRFGWGYAIFVIGLIATVLVGARNFSPGGRYLLLAFPVTAGAGVYLSRRPAFRVITLTGLMCGWILLTWRFARTDSLGW